MLLRFLAGLALSAFLAFSAKADSVAGIYGPLYFPDGATVTSITLVEPPINEPYQQLAYSFGDGTGVTDDPAADSSVGSLIFTDPVTTITFGFTSAPDIPFNVTFYGSNGAPFETISIDPSSGAPFSGTDTVDFDTDVTRMFWILGTGNIGFGGVTSLSYIEADPVPSAEPAPLLLLAIGLAAICGLGLFGRRPYPRNSP